MFKNLRHLIVIELLLLCNFQLSAQFDTNNSTAFTQSKQVEIDPFADTTRIEFFYLSNLDTIYSFNDTTLSRWTHAYDPSRIRDAEYFNLGNNGSAARPIIFEKPVVMGTDYGYHVYDIYRLSNRGFKYYKVNRPFFDFTFTPVGGQQNFVIKSDFARNFSDGMSLSINYDRINQEGFYQSQQVLHTNFGLGIWYQDPRDKRSIFFTFKNEINTEDQNGGVSNRNDFANPFSDERMSIDVVNTGASTRFQHRTYELQHIYHFQDSISRAKDLSLHSTLSLTSGYYKYFDENVGGDQDYYGNFYRDSRGIRNFQGYTRVFMAHDLTGNIIKSLNASLGIEYTYHRLNLESDIINRNDIFINSKIGLPISDKILLNGQAKIGLGSATGDFLMKGDTRFSIGNSIQLSSEINIYRNRHPISANHLTLNGSRFWKNNLDKPFGTQISGKLSFPFFNMKIGVSQLIENNTLYYNTESTPVLFEDVYTSSVLDLSFDFKLWKFNFNNYVAGQAFSNNLFHLPEYYGKSNVYWQTDLFKNNMKLRLGMEGRLIGPHGRIEYNPLLSEFYQSEGEEEIYPLVDFYLLAKVSQFRFFVRMENTGTFLSDQVYYQIGDYPQFDRKIRLGIKWQLYD